MANNSSAIASQARISSPRCRDYVDYDNVEYHRPNAYLQTSYRRASNESRSSASQFHSYHDKEVEDDDDVQNLNRRLSDRGRSEKSLSLKHELKSSNFDSSSSTIVQPRIESVKGDPRPSLDQYGESRPLDDDDDDDNHDVEYLNKRFSDWDRLERSLSTVVKPRKVSGTVVQWPNPDQRGEVRPLKPPADAESTPRPSQRSESSRVRQSPRRITSSRLFSVALNQVEQQMKRVHLT